MKTRFNVFRLLSLSIHVYRKQHPIINSLCVQYPMMMSGIFTILLAPLVPVLQIRYWIDCLLGRINKDVYIDDLKNEYK